jgi:hypothetical protein
LSKKYQTKYFRVSTNAIININFEYLFWLIR